MRVRRVGHERGPKRPIARVYRMAYCGTVTLHDAEGEAIHTLRYGTMPEGDARALCEGMASDVLAMRRKRPGLLVSQLCDGAPEMWNLLDDAFDAETFDGTRVHQLIDFWHVIEKLSAAAQVIEGKNDASGLIARWKLALLNRSMGCANPVLDGSHAVTQSRVHGSPVRAPPITLPRDAAPRCARGATRARLRGVELG